jgi:hypothetical protein
MLNISNFAINSTLNSDLNYSDFIITKIISCISLIIIILALLFNSSALLIFRLSKEMKKMPSMVILSFLCVTDTLR